MSQNPASNHPLDTLPPLERLAIGYAPAAARAAWTGLLAFEQRLADAARPGRDPMMVQLRLAWWRDRMDEAATQWPTGEPLLSVLAPWDAEREALRGLVDGWEARNVGEDGGAELARARVAAMVALGRLVGAAASEADTITSAARQWLGIDAMTSSAAPLRLGRAMRPLAVLRGMALRERAGRQQSPTGDFLTAVRIGLLGR